MYDTVIFERQYNSDIGWRTYAISMPRYASMSKERYLHLMKSSRPVADPDSDIRFGSGTIEFAFENGTWLYEVGELDKDRFYPLTLTEGTPK